MTRAPQTAPAGWYPSPDGAPVQRWWDGTVWTDATLPPEPPASPEPTRVARPEPGPAPSGWPAPPAPRVSGLRTAILVGLLATGLAGLAGIVVHAWGIDLTLLRPAAARTDADVQAYLQAVIVHGAVLLAAWLATTVLWMVWQFRVARALPPDAAGRSPAWHAWSWLVPVVALWFPFQHLRFLYRATTGRHPRWLLAGWLVWLAANVTMAVAPAVARFIEWWPLVAARLGAPTGPLSTATAVALLEAPTVLGVIAGVLIIATVPYRWAIVTQLTNGIRRNGEHPGP